MKILLTTPSFPPIVGGLGNAVHQQALSLIKKGHCVTVVTSTINCYNRDRYFDGMEVIEFKISGADWIVSPIKGEVSKYIQFLEDTKFDVIIMHAWQNWATDLILKNLSKVSGRKYLFSHCISTNEFYFQQPIKSLLRYLAWRPYFWKIRQRIIKLSGIIFLADVVSETRFMDLECCKKLKIPYLIIPNSLSEASYSLTKNARKMSDRELQIISVGSYQWQKGFDFVLRSYAASNAKNIYKLKFFGQNFTEMTSELKKLSAYLGINQSYIEFFQGISGCDLLKEYECSRLFLSGSVTECQPMVLLDSSAAGTPFVARNTGCIKSMRGGLAVTSIKEMAAAIDKIISCERTWEELSMFGKHEAETIYAPHIVAEKLVKAIALN